jgi:hypothetical protein
MNDIKNFVSEANKINVVIVTRKSVVEKLRMLTAVREGFRNMVLKFIESKLKEQNGIQFLKYKPWHKLEDDKCSVLEIANNLPLDDEINKISNIAAKSQFSYDEKILKGIKYYVIIVEDRSRKKALFYGQFGNANIVDRRGKFSIVFDRDTFRTLKKGLTFSESIDCIIWEDKLLIFKKRNFENIFDYFDSLKKVADEIVDKIQEKLEVVNIDDLREIARRDKRILKKMAEMKENKSLEKLDLKKMGKAIKKYNLRFKYIRRRNKNPKITFNPDIKERWKFIKLISEDYFISETTDNKFIATSKRKYR